MGIAQNIAKMRSPELATGIAATLASELVAFAGDDSTNPPETDQR
jgi:hypothetical protein